MRILLISYYFPPFNSVGALRPSKLAKYLVDQGHDVQVLSCSNQPYLSGLVQDVPAQHVTGVPGWSINAPVEWVLGGRQKVANQGFTGNLNPHSIVRKFGQWYRMLLHWPDAQIGWVANAIDAGRKILDAKPYDLIYVSAPPFSGFRIAASLSKEFKVPWVAEFRDLWTDNHSYNFPAWRLFIERYWERSLLSKVSGLVTVSPPLVKKLKKFDKIVWEVRNGYSEEDFNAVQRLENFASDQNCLDIVFTGNVYDEHYDLDSFCNGIALFQRCGGRVKIHVAGRNTGSFQNAAKKYHIETLFIFHGAVTHAIALSMQRSADVLLTFLWQGGLTEGVFSAKLFEYAGARRPILAIGHPSSDVGEIIRTAEIGSVCIDAQAVSSQLQSWLLEKKSDVGLKYQPNPGYDLRRSAQFLMLENGLKGILSRNQKSPKLCFVIANAFALNAFLENPIKKLSRDGWDITVICNANIENISEAIRKNTTLIKVQITRPISPIADLLSLWRLWRIFRKGRFDVVHSITPKAGLLAMFAAWTALVPVRIHTFTGQVWITRKGLMRHLLIFMDRFLAICANHILTDSASQKTILAKYHIAKMDHIQVLGSGSICGVDTQRFSPNCHSREKVRKELVISPDAIVILYVGRLHPEKGIRELLVAFHDLSLEHPDIHLILVGPDEGWRNESLPINVSRVHFIGQTQSPEIYMAAADIFCMPSYREGFGLTLIEAAASGLPTVASNIYGITDAVVDGETGVLTPPGDAKELARALSVFIQNPQLMLSMGRNARAQALDKYSQERMMVAWGNFYDNLRRFEVDGNTN